MINVLNFMQFATNLIEAVINLVQAVQELLHMLPPFV